MVQFFNDILPARGHYRLVRLKSRSAARTTWHHSLPELCQAAGQLQGQAQIYFGTASYAEPTKGEAVNVLLNKALRLDIDAGAEKLAKHKGEGVYPTQLEALHALTRFVKASGLRPSYLVSSGAGWHVYFALEQALAPAQWAPLAERLALLCQTHALQVDNTVTRDVTHLLRVPGSLHSSGRPVQIKRQDGHLYTIDELDALLPRPRVYDAPALALNDEVLQAHAARDWPPAGALKIAGRCEALRQVADTRGDCPEPLWRAMLGVVKHTVEGDEQAHEWSSGHDDYSAQETQKKLDLWRAGPTTCDEFARHCDACDSCPQRGRIKSPIQLGLLSDQEQSRLPPEQQTVAAAPPPPATGKPWDDRLPPDTRVVETPDGHQLQYAIRQTREDEDGHKSTARAWVPVTNTVFWFTRWGESVGGESALAKLRAHVDGRVVTFEMDQQLLATQNELIKFLASKAIHTLAHPLSAKALVLYAKTLFDMIQQSRNSDLTITDRFGLRALDDGALVSVHGRYTIHGDGTIRDTILGRDLRGHAPGYVLPLPGDEHQDEWGAAVWDSHIVPRARQYVDFLNGFFDDARHRCYQLAIMAAIASPMMAFATGEYRGGKLPIMSALTISLYSLRGGYGKTTACQAGALAYGLPGVLVRGQGNDAATGNYRMKRLAISGTMPNVMDEMGGLSPAQTYAMLDTVANGSDKGRARRDGTLIDTAPWALVNLITTNRSLQELLRAPGAAKTDAVQRRILEINVGHGPMHTQEERESFAAEYSRVAEACAGALGAVLERELCRLGLTGVHAIMAKNVSAASRFLAAEQNDRFLYRCLGAILSAMQILKPLGCMPFDIRAVAEEYRRAYKDSQVEIEAGAGDITPLNLLSMALNDLLPSTAITERESRNSTLDRLLNERVPLEIKARHVRSLHRTYVAMNAFNDWAAGMGVSTHEILSAAASARVLLRPRMGREKRLAGRKNLMLGMAGNIGQTVYAYTFDTQILEAALGGVEHDPAAVIAFPSPADASAPQPTPTQQEETT